MTEQEKELDYRLDAYFDALKSETESPSPELLARVLDDAYEEQERFAEVVTPAPAVGRGNDVGWLVGLRNAIGGWPAIAGLATATVAGVWIGYSPPAAFDAVSIALLDSAYGVSMDSSLPEFDFLLTDG